MIVGRQRDKMRRTFVDVWRKHSSGTPLEPLEQSIAAVIDAHPEFQGMLADPDSMVRDYSAQGGETNPFLHMGMHIAIVEQITSDRPTGIRVLHDALRRCFADTHELEHAMVQCLAESLWEAREHGQAPDEQRYLSCVRRLERRVL